MKRLDKKILKNHKIFNEAWVTIKKQENDNAVAVTDTLN